MAEVERLHEVIQLQKRIIGFYSDHHQRCVVLPEYVRSAFDNPEHILREQCNQRDRPPPCDKIDFRIIPFSPTTAASRGKKRNATGGDQGQLKKSKEPNWKVAAKSFIRNTPIAEEWDQRLFDIGVNFSAEQFTQTIQLVSGQITDLIHHQEVQQPVELFERASCYAREVASCMKGADLADSLSRFQLFRFLSYCLVLKKAQLMPLIGIYKIMRVAITGGSDYFLNRLLSRTEGIHRDVLMKLVDAGWTRTRATLLFFFSGPRRPYEYADLSLESFEYIVAQLQREEYIGTQFDRNFGIDFSIASCITSWEPSLRYEP
ncbi:hypothetical protein EJ08DRAFT_694024 [Tothia fuscella]|uniref:Uncharacterized protein n=1 Tax=Tothia fuscella TaxID=1048955 RepID=A0A9P4NYH0_9PEZI|nr:hypothetical protein EJ08DRAFT_694024 [Tothia fuscella]